MVDVSENVEAGVVLASTVSGAVSAFIATSPLPIEWKTPISGLFAALAAGVFAYWKLKINVPVS